jgi:hypothetical protein
MGDCPYKLLGNENPQMENEPIETIDQLFRTNDPNIWKAYIPSFVALYASESSITELGFFLTRDHIPTLMSEMVSNTAARIWVELWSQSVSHEEFEIPVKVLKAAVQYKETGDRRVLMMLPQELRFLLEPLVASRRPNN